MTAEIKLSENSIQISGVLDVHTVTQLREVGTSLLKDVANPVFDLSQVTQCDSSALALLTAWARDAKKLGKEVRFTHLPSSLMAIAKLSALEKVLGL